MAFQNSILKKMNNSKYYKNLNRKSSQKFSSHSTAKYQFINEQIKSKDRVNNHGEVLTPEWLVKDMLDLLPNSVKEIESRYLETSAGEGVFLVEILRRKLDIVFKQFKDTKDREFYTLVALSNIYGLELLKDNVDIARLRLESVLNDYFLAEYNRKLNSNFLKSAQFIINLNIIHMDSLNYKVPTFNDNNQIMRNVDNLIIYDNELARISEWIIDYSKKAITRVEYIYSDVAREQRERYLVNIQQEKMKSETCIHKELDKKNDEAQKLNCRSNQQLTLFDLPVDQYIVDSQDKSNNIEITVAKPVKIYNKVGYLNLTKS